MTFPPLLRKRYPASPKKDVLSFIGGTYAVGAWNQKALRNQERLFKVLIALAVLAALIF